MQELELSLASIEYSSEEQGKIPISQPPEPGLGADSDLNRMVGVQIMGTRSAQLRRKKAQEGWDYLQSHLRRQVYDCRWFPLLLFESLEALVSCQTGWLKDYSLNVCNDCY